MLNLLPVVFYSILSLFNSVEHETDSGMVACNLNVNAGQDIQICAGEEGLLDGMITGNYDDYEWSPTIGLSDPFSLSTNAGPPTTTTYTLTARGEGSDLIVNGGFENGAINPSTTALTFVAPANFALSGGGSYTVATSATFGNIWGCQAHSGGFAMGVNGASSAGAFVWCQTVNVTPNSDYKFSAWAMGINIPFLTTPASLSFTINGQTVTAIVTSGSTCTWNEVTATWNSGGATTATICILTHNNGANWFAIDDISFTECCVAKDEVTVEVIDIQAFAQPAGPITCDNNTLILDGSLSTKGPGYTPCWTTSNGLILSGAMTYNPVIGAPGEYTLTIKGPANCEKEVTIIVEGNVTPPDAMTFAEIITCDKPNARVSANSSNPDVSYEWVGPNGFSIVARAFNTDVPGTYIVRVGDQYNCVTFDTVVVRDERQLPDLSILGDTLSCLSDSIVLKGKSRSWNLTYLWKGPNGLMSQNDSIFVKDTGTFILTVVDSNNCEVSDTFVVLELDVDAGVSANADTITCTQPFANLSGSSDSINVTYTWTGPNGYRGQGQNVQVTDSGTYVLKVELKGGCIFTDTIVVHKADDVPTISVLSDTITCIDTIADLIGRTSTLNSTFEWSGPNGFMSSNPTVMVRDSGTYVFKVIGPNGCSIEQTIRVLLDNDIPILTLSADTLTCTNDSIRLQSNYSGNESLNYIWSGSNGYSSSDANPFVFSPGTYTLRASGANGCEFVNTIEVYEDRDEPVIMLESDTLNCTTTDVNILLTSGDSIVSYQWSGPNGYTSFNQNPNINEAGKYTVTAIGSNGCISIEEIDVLIDTVKPIFELSGDTLSCETPEVLIEVLNTNIRGSASWSGPNGFSSNNLNIMVVDSGWYNITYIGANGCEKEDSIFIEQKDALPNISATGDTITCADEFANLIGQTTTPNTIVRWTGPNGYEAFQNQIDVDVAGTYIFEVISAAGCTSRITLVVEEDIDAPVVGDLSSDTLTCDIKSVQINADAIGEIDRYEWSGPNGFNSMSQDPTVNEEGWYILTVIGKNGCTTIDSIFVPALDDGPAIFGERDTLTCIKTSANLSASSPISNLVYNWQGPNNYSSFDSSNTVTVAGTYTLTVTDANGCTSTLSVEIIEHKEMASGNIIGDSLYCTDDEATLTATSGVPNAVFKWILPSGNEDFNVGINTSESGRYLLVTTHPASGCSDTTAYDLARSNDTLQSVDLNITDAGCDSEFGSLTIGNVSGSQGPYQFAVDGFDFSSEINYNDLASGIHVVRILDKHGCIQEFAFTVNSVVSHFANLPGILKIKAGESVNLRVDTDLDISEISSIVWTPATGLSCTDCLETMANPAVTTTYTVTILDIYGCNHVAMVTIEVDGEVDVFVPNIFSPNGDNINDRFKLHSSDELIVKSFEVYDRWGELLYRASDVLSTDDFGWDGTFKGETVIPNVYVYRIAYILPNNESKKLSGEITLIR